MLAYLFVYGTLRRGEPLHGELVRANAELVGEASMRGTLYLLGWYPGARPEGDQVIRGELYLLPEPRSAFRRLDAVEGGEFRRRVVLVRQAGGDTRRAWAYLLKRRPPCAVTA